MSKASQLFGKCLFPCFQCNLRKLHLRTRICALSKLQFKVWFISSKWSWNSLRAIIIWVMNFDIYFHYPLIIWNEKSCQLTRLKAIDFALGKLQLSTQWENTEDLQRNVFQVGPFTMSNVSYLLWHTSWDTNDNKKSCNCGSCWNSNAMEREEKCQVCP